jgi:hypothetical protein
MGLDDGPTPPCPFCHGSLRAGPPPAPAAAPAPEAVEAGPPPVETVVVPPAPIGDEEMPEIDIRRRDLRLPTAPRPAAPRASAWGAGKFVWLLVLVSIGLSRACISTTHRPVPLPPPVHLPPVQMPPVPHFQMPQPMAPAEPGLLLQRASWEKTLSRGQSPSRLYLSGPEPQWVGVLTRRANPVEAILDLYDADTGAPLGNLAWHGPAELADVGLGADGTVAALVTDQNRRVFEIYQMPAGQVVLKDWDPYPEAMGDGKDGLWFAIISPDRLLTVLRHERLELWSVSEKRRLYSIELQPPAKSARRAITISPDRRTVAVANREDGFTFYESATGVIHSKTSPLPANVRSVRGCGFDPDGKHFACAMKAAGPAGVESGWVSWSYPEGKETAQWPARWENGAMAFDEGWTFWDANRVVPRQADADNKYSLRDRLTGSVVGLVELNEPSLLLLTSGRRLWYVCADRLAVVPQRHLASIELPPDGFIPAPARPGQAPLPIAQWRLTPHGLFKAAP